MEQLDLLRRALDALDHHAIPYMLVGYYASGAWVTAGVSSVAAFPLGELNDIKLTP